MTEAQAADFDSLFREIAGVPGPFPWQRALFRDIRDTVKGWPGAVDVPTGLGKTAVMTVWYVARRLGVKAPRRLVYVVDRRTVVDQATAEADKLKDWDQSSPDPLGLRVSTLRGQHIDNREWLSDPAAPAIIVGTVDMIGSRLLFEGYGVSRRMRPAHAGLLGCDTLLVLDESHLCPPFEALLRRIAEAAEDLGAPAPVPGPRLLTLSATGRDAAGGATLSLTNADRDHPEVKRRLTADKRLTIQDVGKEPELQKQLVDAARDLAQSHCKVLVFCDSRKMAEKIKADLDKTPGAAVGTRLLVGARRVAEREQDRVWLEAYGFLPEGTATGDGPAILVATSAGEVGVDIDADAMACDLVPFERMVQRLGRVNRRGGAGRAAPVRVFAAPRKGEKPEDARERLARLAAPLALLPVSEREPEARDASPGALDALKQRAGADKTIAATLARATTPPPLYPALTRAHVDAWAMTSLETHPGRALVQPWLRGWVSEEPQTTVAWRRHLPWPKEAEAPSKDDVKGWLEAAPVLLLETLEARTDALVDMMLARAKVLRALPEDQRWELSDPVGLILNQDGTLREALRLGRFAAAESDRRQKDELFGRLIGRRLILRADFGGLDEEGSLKAEASEPPIVADDAERSAALFDAPFLAGTHLPKDVSMADWREAFSLPLSSPEAEEPETLTVWVRRRAGDGRRTGDPAFSRHAQALDTHLDWAAQDARDLAERLGLAHQWVEVLETAARLHDLGKRREHWQTAMGAPREGRPYAKTTGGGMPGALAGYRHEFGSLVDVLQNPAGHPTLAALDEDRRDLVLHLVAAHHGYARPVITSFDPEWPPEEARKRAREAALRFARLHRRWGPWGLAWWETLLRAADWRASGRLDDPGREDA
ncbi:type I-G CRISPR-associated helicase/endonuclease Cas3g [Rhodospira trueperi]|uniref:CRISPR-associated endonuclease/helicase Cas3 n=1 Tax=Rhodospira trueperi TaxID=69960 RepID=A0A1G7EG23_9PROT|nr:type I-U CRISPR-associated helicase/endonuclease Cas3 [Rhodospira trueperi]SDE62594.1 CRISPR-associated endonuclease/helicase Cas3 [Rhodospira trueperi]